MPAEKIRSDHDQLKKMAKQWSGQSDAAGQIMSRIKSDFDVLQGGDWRGEGAAAFFAEMGDEVLPAMKRLQEVLREAGEVTAAIQQLMEKAEETAANAIQLPA